MRNNTDHETDTEEPPEKHAEQIAGATDGSWRHPLARILRHTPGAARVVAPYRRLLDTLNLVERRVAVAEARLRTLSEQETHARASHDAIRDADLEERLAHLEATLSSLARRLDQLTDASTSSLQRIEATAATHTEHLQALRRPSARSGTYLGDDRILFTTVHGHMMLCDAKDLSITPTLLEYGLFEPGTTSVFLRLAHAGMNIIEVGANIGYYTLLGGHQIRPTGKYLAFEPTPRAFALLETNIALYSLQYCVEAVNLAVFDTATQLTLHTYDATLGHTTIHRIEDERFARAFGYRGTFTADAVSLDGYLSDREMRVDLVKIDAERSEPHILRGMRQTLIKHPDIQVIFEVWPDTFSEADVDPYREMGFRFWRIDFTTGELTSIETFGGDATHRLRLTDVLMSRRDDPFTA
ncbi:MAG: FkbM family methyltransferase [Thermomicrobiales bacterium]